MNPHHHAWMRLTAAARRAPVDARGTTAPYGFATRVAAMAFAAPAERPISALFERISLRALAVAALLAMLSVAAHLSPVLNGIEEDVFAAQDPVIEVLALGLSGG